MSQDPLQVQRAVKENADEIQRALRDIQDWSSEMKEKSTIKFKPLAAEVNQGQGTYPRVIQTYSSPPAKNQVAKVNPKDLSEKKPSPSELTEFKKSRPMYANGTLTAEDLCKKYKEGGLTHFKNKKYQLAILCFTEAIKNAEKSKTEEFSVDFASQLYNNRSASHYYLGNFESSIKDASLALKLKPEYFKSMFRIIQCFMSLDKYKCVVELCEKAEKFQPGNEEIKKIYQDAKQKIAYAKLYKIKTVALTEDDKHIGQGDQQSQGKSAPKLPKLDIEVKPQEVSLQSPPPPSQNGLEEKMDNDKLPRPLAEQLSQKVVKESKSESKPKIEVSTSVPVPPKPISSTQFYSSWKNVKKNSEIAAEYLKQMSVQDFKIFKNSMESDVLSEILHIVHSVFLSSSKMWLKESEVIIEGLLHVERLGTLLMFLSDEDCDVLRQVLIKIDRKALHDIYKDKFNIVT